MFASLVLPGTNSSGSKITVGSTAQTVEDLIRTASGDPSFELEGKWNAIDIYVEAENIRFYKSGAIPTATLGNPLSAGDTFLGRGLEVRKVQMIRTGATDATVTIDIGHKNLSN